MPQYVQSQYTTFYRKKTFFKPPYPSDIQTQNIDWKQLTKWLSIVVAVDSSKQYDFSRARVWKNYNLALLPMGLLLLYIGNPILGAYKKKRPSLLPSNDPKVNARMSLSPCT